MKYLHARKILEVEQLGERPDKSSHASKIHTCLATRTWQAGD